MDFLCIISQEFYYFEALSHTVDLFFVQKMGKKHSTLNVTRATEIKIKHLVESPWWNLMQRLE